MSGLSFNEKTNCIRLFRLLDGTGLFSLMLAVDPDDTLNWTQRGFLSRGVMLPDWERVFAWRPVRLNSGKWRWLTFVDIRVGVLNNFREYRKAIKLPMLSPPDLTSVRSSNVSAVGHDERGLWVRFIGKRGALGPLYLYPAAGREHHEALLATDSPGRYVLDRLKFSFEGVKVG